MVEVLAAALLGLLFGVGADRLAARWPAHESGTVQRPVDWRTLVVALSSAAIFGALVVRWSEPRDLLLLALFAAALVILLATDLDQKLLPDLVTLPLIAFSTGVLLAGWSPLLADDPNPLLSGLLAGLGAPVILFLLDLLLRGALGLGDLKLAVSIGLLSGVSRFFTGFVIASGLSSIVLLTLIATRRIGLKTAIPFGPVLIGAAFTALLLG
jgi:leader peptidase (prepilin peptidase) / N-methyltransferase